MNPPKLTSLRTLVCGLLCSTSIAFADPAPAPETVVFREGANPSISGDGSWLAYECNSRKGLCLTDTSTGATEVLVTVGGILQDVDISQDGMVIAYWVRPGTKGSEQLFVYDRHTASTELVSVNSDEVPGTKPSNLTVSSLYSEPRLSGNGRHVIFSSYADNLVANDSNTYEDVFIRDREAGTTTRLSVALNGAQGNGDSGDWGDPSMLSADGLTAIFKSSAENLEPNDIADNASPYNYRYDDIYMVDTLTGSITRISEVAGSSVGGDSWSAFPAMSLDGKMAVFLTGAENLHNGPYSHSDLLLYNRSSGSLTHVNPPAFGAPQNVDMYSKPALNYDGSILYFQSGADNLVVGDTPFSDDVFAFQNGALQMIRPTLDGAPASVETPDSNDIGDIMAFGAPITVGGVYQYYGVGIYKRGDFLAPVVSDFSLIPDGPVGQGVLLEVTATVSDVDRGNTDIQEAEYSIDSGAWVSLPTSDAVFDNETEQLHGYIDTSGLAFGTHTLCIRAQDAAGQMSIESCVDFEVALLGSANDFLLYCYHTPLWPQPGDTVEIRMYTFDIPEIDNLNVAYPVDRAEIWLNDRTAPAFTSSDFQRPSVLAHTSAPLAEGNFFYGCRAKLGNKSAFTGWRTVAVGSTGLNKPIPVGYTGPSSDRLDIVFVADADSYSGASDPTFLEDINKTMRVGFYGLPLYNQYQHMYNFWIASDTGTADRELLDDGTEKKTVTKPTGWDDNYAFANAGAIIHTDAFRDFSGNGMFTFEPGQSRTLRHESAHSLFGLSDEYCCNTGYYQQSVLPNVYTTLNACEVDAPALGRVATDCRSWVSDINDEMYFSSEPEPNDLMNNNTLPNAADIRRIEWVFDQCLSGKC